MFLSDFVTTVFPIARTVMVCIIAAAAVVLTICALMQDTDNDQSTSALTGQDKIFSKFYGKCFALAFFCKKTMFLFHHTWHF